MSSNTLKTIMGILKANKIPVYDRVDRLAIDTADYIRSTKICNILTSMGFIGGDEPLKHPELLAKWSKHYNFMQRRCADTYDISFEIENELGLCMLTPTEQENIQEKLLTLDGWKQSLSATDNLYHTNHMKLLLQLDIGTIILDMSEYVRR